jgi:hypothetical protein
MMQEQRDLEQQNDWQWENVDGSYHPSKISFLMTVMP